MADRLQQVHITTASLQVQGAQNAGECRPTLSNEDSLSITQNENRSEVSNSSGSALHITSKELNTIWYRGIFGHVAIREKWIRTRRLGSRTDGKPVPAQKVLTVTSPFLMRAFELYFGTSFASVPRALRMYQLVDFHAPIWEMCSKGDLDGIQDEFANGRFYPFVVTELGRTLLHVVFPVVSLISLLMTVQCAAFLSQSEVCTLLLRLGLDPDRADTFG